jgi:hypothetical protein
VIAHRQALRGAAPRAFSHMEIGMYEEHA